MTAKATPPSSPEAWRIELYFERCGFFSYDYRQVSVERVGKRASVREFVFGLDYDLDQVLLTKPRQIVRRRGRSLTLKECNELWKDLMSLSPERFPESCLCLDDRDPASLDPCVDPEGTPIAVSTGEEGPACLSIRLGRGADQEQLKRTVIERYRESSRDALSKRQAKKSPMAAFVALIDPGLRNRRAFNYRRSRTAEDLTTVFRALKALDFLNLRQFERRSLEALGWLGDPQAVPFLLEELFASDPRVRLQALNALAAIGDPAATAEVELLYDDDERVVRERAREVLELLGEESALPHGH